MKVLTVVYTIPDTMKSVEEICSHPLMSKCSWSDAISARDNALRGLVNLKEHDDDLIEKCCSIIYGHCSSDNVAQRTVEAIRKQFS